MTDPAEPKAMRDLIQLLDQTGWSYAVNRQRASGGAPFVTVTGRAMWDHIRESDISVCWHTYPTGTYRLSSASTGYGPRQRDCSLKTVRAMITPRPEEADHD